MLILHARKLYVGDLLVRPIALRPPNNIFQATLQHPCNIYRRHGAPRPIMPA